MLLSFAASILVLGLLFFLPAQRLDWPGGWLTFSVVVGSALTSAAWLHRVNPELLQRRRWFGKNTQPWDYGLVLNLLLSLPCQIVIGALDCGRDPAPLKSGSALLGLACYLVGCWILQACLRANPYFESSVRLQSDRQQSVVRSGVYAYVRHPGYSAMFFLSIGISALLGSWWSLVGLGMVATVLTSRAILEEDFLGQALEGYQDYRRQVRWRFFPGLW